MRHLALFTALAIVLSGCSGSGGDEARPQALGLAAGLAGISGVVVDTELLPISEASALLGDSLVALTDENGFFQIDNVSVGTHRLVIEKRGYTYIEREVEFSEGVVLRETFILERLASDVPYLSVMIQQGLLNCGWALVIHSAFCGGNSVQPVFGPFRAELRFLMPEGHKLTIAETHWDQTDQTMHNWYRDHTNGNGTGQARFITDEIGQPPLRRVFEPGVLYPAFYSAPSVEHIPFPEAVFPFHVATFYDGSFQREANQTAYAVCENGILGYCSGVGVAVQFRYSQYVSVFVNGIPPSAHEFTAVPAQ